MPESRYQPMQPVEVDAHGVQRFRRNLLVEYLLDNGGIDLTQLRRVDFPREDREQFQQLIGYSVSAAPISAHLSGAAELCTDGSDTDRARITYLETELARIRSSLAQPISELFNIHPDDLTK